MFATAFTFSFPKNPNIIVAMAAPIFVVFPWPFVARYLKPWELYRQGRRVQIRQCAAPRTPRANNIPNGTRWVAVGLNQPERACARGS